MCNEREKLIGYLHDEVDAAERRSIDAHLSTCEACREELRAFRDVRHDLLAWDVPEHESVWTPFVTTRQQPVWRQMPAWAMAAAATLVFAIGGAGGFAGRALAARSIAPVQIAAVPVNPEPAIVGPAASLEDLRALQTRLNELERAAPVRAVSTTPVSMSASTNAALISQVEQLIRDSEGRMNHKTSQKILSIITDIDKSHKADFATLQQQISDSQERTNGNILAMKMRTEKEKE